MNKISSTDFVSLKRHKEAAWLYYEKLKQFEKALYVYKGYVHYDSLFQDYANKNKISELELNAEVRLYEQEMADKEQARKLRNLVETGIVALVLLTIILVTVWGYKKIKRAQKQRTETEIINQYQATEIERLEKQLLNQLAAIRAHNASYEALLVQNSVEASNSENNKTIDTAVQETIIAEKGNGMDNQPSNHILILKAFDLTQKEQWKDFKESFNSTYPDFEQNIVAKIGPVSAAELRLMMLLKFGLNNREIAQTLLITIDGVKKAKYRLYKKIGVGSFREMDAFFC
jgi:DNA-binding CsgD family transcriptional regulator